MLNNEDRKFIEENVEQLLELIDSNSNCETHLETNNDFMTLMCELMGATDWLFQSACMFSNLNGLNKNQAIITGHLIRIRKLYRGLRIHASENQLELVMVFHRPIFETIIYMIYMIMNESNLKTFESFVVTSHMEIRELFFHLKEQSGKRELINIEKRMLDSITMELKRDGVSDNMLRNCKHKNVDGKHFKQILEDIDFNYDTDGFGRGYSLYRSTSRSIHPNWRDMVFYSLTYKDGNYFPRFHFCSVDMRSVGNITILSLGCLHAYIELIEKWNATHLSTCDNDMDLLDNFKSSIIKLYELINKLELAHEEKLGYVADCEEIS